MNLEDRLRNQLHSQSTQITADAPSIEAVAKASGARARRRTATFPAAALLVVGALGSIWAIQRSDNGPDPVDAVSIVADDGESTPEESGQTTVEDDVVITEAGSLGSAQVADDSQDPADSAPGGFLPGTELVIEDISSDSSPGGWGPFEVVESNGIYYVLSTAPGDTGIDAEGNWVPTRPDTIYTYDGGNWAVNAGLDRLVADFDGSNGVLYAVSTGTVNDIGEFALGTSADGGQNWNWDTLPTGGNDPSTLGPQFATSGDTKLVVSSLPTYDRNEKAAALATEAGLAISSYDIWNADNDGFTYAEPIPPATECIGIRDAFWQSVESNFDEFQSEDEYLASIDETQNDLYAALRDGGCEELATCTQVTDAFYSNQGAPDLPDTSSNEEWEAYWRAQQRELEQRLIDAGCQGQAECSQIDRVFYESNEFNPPFDTPEFDFDLDRDLNDEEIAQLDAAWGEYNELADEWYRENSDRIDQAHLDLAAALQAAGCAAYGFANPASYEEPDVRTVTWDELGVPSPGWDSTHIVIAGPDGVQEVDHDFAGYVLSVTADDDGFEVRTSAPSYTGAAQPTQIWRSPDGVTWTNSGESNSHFDPATIGNQTYMIQWSESDGSYLSRSVDGSPFAPVALTDLAPSLDEDYEPISVVSGPFGIVVSAVKVTEPDSRASYSPAFATLFSTDGTRWSSQDGGGYQPTVGSDSILFFDQDAPPNDDTPQPVFLGRLDN